MASEIDETTRQRPRFRTRSKILLACLVALLMSGAVEVGLRLAGFSHPLPYYPDEFCAARLQPGFSGWWSKEGAARIRINSAGFRDREHSVEKPPGVIRVAVLGDSYIEAFQVSQDAMFGSVLERELNARAAESRIDQAIEVLSFGVSGYSTAQELLALRHHVWQFDPDIVLLAFLPANDVRGNSRQLESNHNRPFFDVVDGEPVPDFSFRDDPVYQYALTRTGRLKTAVINSSRIAQLVYAVRSREQTPAAATGSATDVGLDDECFRRPQTDEWRSAWQMTERLIEQMQREVTQRGRQFAVAVVTSSLQVHPDPEVRNEYRQRLGVENLSYADQRIVGLGRRVSFETIILSEPLREFAERTGRFVHGFANTRPGHGHWNEDGHREAARACADTIVSLAAAGSHDEQKKATGSGNTQAAESNDDRKTSND